MILEIIGFTFLVVGLTIVPFCHHDGRYRHHGHHGHHGYHRTHL